MADQDKLHTVTRLLNELSDGDQGARDQLLSLVYQQLRRIAQGKMNQERGGHTLQATALVHEAYLKLAGSLDSHDWQNRSHFYCVAADAMRQILIDHARRHRSAKRGGGRTNVGLNVLDLARAEDNSEAIMALEEAFCRLEEEDADLAEVVRLRFFAGLEVPETAEALGVSARTVIRRWTLARAWLYEALAANPE